MNYRMAFSMLVMMSILGSYAVSSAGATTNTKDCPDPGSIKTDTLKVIVVQCSNGYTYAQRGYSFNHVIEKELDKFENIHVQPLPLKALMGVSYQGVFDKKYCPPIIEKVDADFLVLTRFASEYLTLNTTETGWGYELRIVSTRNLEQANSISAHSLKEYKQIEQHIKDNINTLRTEIENLK